MIHFREQLVDIDLKASSAQAVQLQALLSEHARRANRYLLVNTIIAVLLGGAGAFVAAMLIGPSPVLRFPLFWILWVLWSGAAFWRAQRRRWTAASAAYTIDRALDCDNLLRSAWIGMHQSEPAAFLELNLRQACRAAEQFQPPPPWPLVAWYASTDWVRRRKKTLLNVLFYLILLLLLALWLYTLLTRTSPSDSDGKSNADRADNSRPASDTPSAVAGEAGSQGERTPSAGSTPSGTKPAGSMSPGDRVNSKGSDAQAPANSAAGVKSGEKAGAGQSVGNERSGPGSASAGSPGASAGTGSTSPSTSGAQKGADTANASGADRSGGSYSDRPGTTSTEHPTGGVTPDAARDKKLIVMPGMNTPGADGQRSSTDRGLKNLKTAAQQQAAEEVQPPGRVPREYERFLKDPN